MSRRGAHRPGRSAAPLALRLAPPLALLLAASAPRAAAAQRALERRVAGVGDGRVRFHYAVREGVCGDGGRQISIRGPRGTSRVGEFRSGDAADGWGRRACVPGPARVTLQVAGGAPRAVRVVVGEAAAGRGGDDEPAGGRAVDLGAVPAAEAAAYLLRLAARPDLPSSERVLLGAVIADSATVWPRLLEVARDARAPGAARREATFWAGQAACDAFAVRGAPAPGDTARREERREVVFALSQRPAGERTATLERVARADRDPEVRCAAVFWLGQGAGRGAPDARVLDLYAELLRAR